MTTDVETGTCRSCVTTGRRVSGVDTSSRHRVVDRQLIYMSTSGEGLGVSPQKVTRTGDRPEVLRDGLGEG